MPQSRTWCAMFRVDVRIHSRGKAVGAKGGNIVASAAYRSGSKLAEAVAYRAGEAIEAEGITHDFTRKQGVVFSEIHTPMDAPERFSDRGELWRAVAASERRRDAQLARELIVSIPRGLSRDQGIDLVRGFVSAELVERGMIVDACWHDVKAGDGGRNFHAHLLCTTRHVGPNGFGLKAREWNRRELVPAWREAWGDHCNYALEQAGRAERVDHRSLETQRQAAARAGDWHTAAALDREPARPLGPRAAAMERRGIATRTGDHNRAIEARNAARAALYARLAHVGNRAKAAFLALRDRIGDALQTAERVQALEQGQPGASRQGLAAEVATKLRAQRAQDHDRGR